MSRAPGRLLLTLALMVGLLAPTAASASDLPPIWFPTEVSDRVQWSDTYGQSRGGGRTHKGVDIMAPQMTPLYAVQSGYIARAYGGDSRECLDGGRCTSYGLLLYADDGRAYFYLHLNDDTPGRPNGCDHLGGAENAFSPRLVEVLRERGSLEPRPARYDPQDVVRVEQGEHIGYVGSSGNAGCKVDHLHFETWRDHVFRSANDPGKDNPTPQVDAAVRAKRFWGPDGPIRPAKTGRLAGPSRLATAIEVSRAAFPSARTAVVAPAEIYPEALVAAPLATWLGGPVLLAWGHPDPDGPTVDPALVAELERLGVEDVVVVGADGNVVAGFEDALARATGLGRDRIRRISAPDRYALSTKVAREILDYVGFPMEADEQDGESQGGAQQWAEGVIEEILGPNQKPTAPDPVTPLMALGEHEVEGRGWPDALAAATLAAAERVPVLLTRPGSLPDATRAVLEHDGFSDVRIVGGTGAVSSAVEQAVRDLGHATRRLAGTDRYATALAVASELMSAGHSIRRVHVATGRNFPDAMAAGAAIARLDGVMVMVDGVSTANSQAVLDWLRRHEAAIDEVVAVGGPRVITDDSLRRLATHANWPREG